MSLTTVLRRGRGRLGRRGRGRDEGGAYAVLFAVLVVLLMGLAAIGVDIASQVASKQELKDTVDAAAHAAAFELPDNAAGAAAMATKMARATTAGATPVTDFWCVVASTGADKKVNVAQIPSTCNPGAAPYVATNPRYAGLVCDEVLCFIPCVIGPSTKCNTIRVADAKTVPYAFAPAIGFNEGSTGTVVSVACKGPCGTETPNPMDIVVVADRTASMKTADRATMKNAILESLKLMNRKMHYVAFGTIAKSRTGGFTSSANTYGPQTDDYMVENPDCLRGRCDESALDSTSRLNYNGHWDGTGKTNARRSYCLSEANSYATSSAAVPPITKWDATIRYNGRNYSTPDRPTPSVSEARVKAGTWVPVGFTNEYLINNPDPLAPAALNYQSDLVDSVSCLSQSMVAEFGTQLASALKATVKYAFDNNPEPTRPGKIRKVIIFETDGEPSEPGTNFGNTDLDSGDVVNSNGVTGCNNLKAVADKAKARYKENLVIVTIGFGDAAKTQCGGSGQYVRDVLAYAASDSPSGGASEANACNTPALQSAENSDGDYFFCATDGSDLDNIFATAMTTVGGSIRILKMPS